MRHFSALALMAIVLGCAFPTGAASLDSIDLFEIRDPTLVIELWKAAEAEGQPASGTYQVLIRHPSDTVSKKVLLLREGTQILELPEFTVSFLSGGRAKRIDPEESKILRAPETNVWQGLWKQRDSVVAWLQWPTGIVAGWQTSLSGVGGRTQIDRDIRFHWMHTPYRFVHFELGVQRSQYGGDLSSSLYPSSDTNSSAFWSQGHWWWQASFGIPGILWEIALANRAMPEFYWLDPFADSAARQHIQGKVIRQWAQGTKLKNNLSQSLRVKLGSLRYAMHLDGDAYRFPIHEAMLEELPAPFGPWGFGLVLAGPTVFTRSWVDILPVNLGFSIPRSWPSVLRFAFLRLDLAYRDKKNYHLSVATRVSWDNPLLRWPGVKP